MNFSANIFTRLPCYFQAQMVTMKMTQTPSNMIKLKALLDFLTIHTIVSVPRLPAALTCWFQKAAYYSPGPATL